MAGSDVRTKRITGTGSLGVGPARIRQIQLKTASGTPRLTVTDGSRGAATGTEATPFSAAVSYEAYHG